METQPGETSMVLLSLAVMVAVLGWLRVCRGAVVAGLVSVALTACASGPQWVAGMTYFNSPGAPVVWANGALTYYIDQGSLSSSVSQAQTLTLLHKAAAVWSGVPTAAVSIVYGGALAEDVNGSNVTANSPAGTGAVLPSDVRPSAVTRPVGVVMDEDGSVINAIYGPDASDPANCTQDGVFTVVDNVTAGGNIAHGLMIVNGRCATTTAQVALLAYEMVRGFGRLLGLDWSQVNDAMFTTEKITTEGLAGWPVMHPQEWLCSGTSYGCMPGMATTTLRTDDVAGENRLYPVTSANMGAFPGKVLTAQNTISVQGTIAFKQGQGMQGVNVVLTPVVGGVPLVQYSVSAVSGVSFARNAGNSITGPVDAQGKSLNRYGTDNAAMEGFFDLSGVPLPGGVEPAEYQLSFEAVNPAYVDASSSSLGDGKHGVGPYATSQVAVSGTMPVIALGQLGAGSVVKVPVAETTIEDSAAGTSSEDGIESAPDSVRANGEWLGRLSGYGHVGWFSFTARANRTFTVEATALDETGMGTTSKADVLIGVWNGSSALGSLPVLSTADAFNGRTTGLTTLSAQLGDLPGVTAVGAPIATLPGDPAVEDQVRVALGDARGDGRPDYGYRGRVLYADTVFPARLTYVGGPIVITGSGFRPNAKVMVGGIAAMVTGVTPTEITAVAPPVVHGAAGVAIVTVEDPATLGSTSILDGLSYDAYGTDELNVLSAPTGSIAEGVPVPFTVRVLAGDGVHPAANVAVSFAVTEGGAGLGCGSATCTVTSNGSGMVTMMLTPASSQTTQVVASLTSGSTVTAVFSGSVAGQMKAVTPVEYVATGSYAAETAVSWQPEVVVLNHEALVSGAGVVWSSISAGVTVAGGASTTNSAGQASGSVLVGAQAANATATVSACLAQSPGTCAQVSILAEDASRAVLVEVSGAGQELAAPGNPSPVVLEVTDALGRPLAGATVNFYETLNAWQPPCSLEGRCPEPQTLAKQGVRVTSDANGMVTLTPLTLAGVASTLVVNATVGEQSSLIFSIVQNP
jgi:hypothetical protein